MLEEFYSRTRLSRKVLVVGLGFLGDSVHLIPALWELKRHYPQAQLHVLTTPVGAQVLAMVPCVHRAWEFPLSSPSPPWWHNWRILPAIRREHFDLALTFSHSDRAVICTGLSGARWRLGCRGGRNHFWNPWLIPTWAPPQDPQLPLYEQHRNALAICGLKLVEPQFNLAIPPEPLAKAARLVPSGSVHFSINASSPLREWPIDHWITLGRNWLAGRPQGCVVSTAGANPREQARLQRLARDLPDPRVLVIPGAVSISELAAILSRCELHVGPDSGVLHLAAAVGLPTVGLFRRSEHMHKWLPRAGENLSEPCDCVDRADPPCAAAGSPVCLNRISPLTVLAAMERLTPPRHA